MAFLMFYVTHPDQNAAQATVDRMIDLKIAACGNIFPMTSAYWWNGNVAHEAEWVSILKTRPELERAVENAVQEMHPYDIPCIIRFEVSANDAYEKWIRENTI